jgi:hypothetical protein
MQFYNFPLEIWQASLVNHRIRDAEDYKHHHTYIWQHRTEEAAEKLDFRVVRGPRNNSQFP